MKTKHTLLLALATAGALHAEKPAFNGQRAAAANLPAAPARSIPSSGSISHSRVNAGQIIGFARQVLPLVQTMSAPPQQSMPAVVKTPSAVKKPAISRSSGGSNFKAPAAASIPNTAPAVRNTPDARLGGITGNQAAGIREGMEIANGLRSLNDLRNSMPEGLRENLGFGNRPAGPGKPDLDIGNGGGFKGRDLNNPLDRNSRPSGSLTNIRDRMSRSRLGKNDGPPTGAGGDRASRGIRTEDGWSGTQSRSTSSDGRTVVSDTQMFAPDGSREHYHEKAVDTDGDGDAETITHRVIESVSSSGETNSQVTTQNPDGSYTTETSSVTPGEVPESTVTTTSDAPAPASLDHIDTSGRHGCSIGPDDGGALGGPIGPTVQGVTGLTDLDLLRQFANGEAPQGGGNYMTRPNNSVQVRPPSPDGTSNTRSNRSGANIDLLQPEGRGINGIGGGDRPD